MLLHLLIVIKVDVDSSSANGLLTNQITRTFILFKALFLLFFTYLIFFFFFLLLDLTNISSIHQHKGIITTQQLKIIAARFFTIAHNLNQKNASLHSNSNTASNLLLEFPSRCVLIWNRPLDWNKTSCFGTCSSCRTISATCSQSSCPSCDPHISPVWYFVKRCWRRSASQGSNQPQGFALGWTKTYTGCALKKLGMLSW